MYKKKCSKLEEINSLKKTLAWNYEAVDYMENHISSLKDILNFNPDDCQAKYELDTSKYISFSLSFLEDCYIDRLKKLGVNICKIKEVNFDWFGLFGR